MYHPNNTPPKSVLASYNSTPSEHESYVAFENELYQIINKEYYYALYKKGDRDDKYIILRDCNFEQATNIAKGLSLLTPQSVGR